LSITNPATPSISPAHKHCWPTCCSIAIRPSPRQQIAFSLWPDSTERQAFTNLRGLLFDLRRALPHAEHFLKANTLSLNWRNEAAFTLDVAEVEQALQQLEQTNTPDVATVERVVVFYRGELLPTCYDEWLLPIRRALHE
jgi:DNA-binding SARP family transcriptional activator